MHSGRASDQLVCELRAAHVAVGKRPVYRRIGVCDSCMLALCAASQHVSERPAMTPLKFSFVK